MSILDLAEIQQRLSKKYHEHVEEFPQHFKGLIPLGAPDTQEASVAAVVATTFEKPLPQSFSEILKIWDLGNLSLAGFRFAIEERYADAVIRMNSKSHAEWWAGQKDNTRPDELIMVAQSDPYVLLLHLKSGEILALNANTNLQEPELVAHDVHALFRALGTAELESPNALDPRTFSAALAQALGDEVSLIFWSDQVDHWTQFK